jgi:APA family basic amino acid/polyamine antiporter
VHQSVAQPCWLIPNFGSSSKRPGPHLSMADKNVAGHDQSSPVSSFTGGQRLAKTIRAGQFFTLCFAAIVGTGWIVVVGEWLRQAGPLGAIIAFLVAGFVMMLVGLCYAELVTMIPVSGGEIAYAYEIFGLKTSFVTGWFLALVCISATSFEAISAGWITGVLFPGLRGSPLYTIAGVPVRIGELLVAVAGITCITMLNYRSTETSATVQEVFTYVKLAILCLFILVAVVWGRIDNARPFFTRTGSRLYWSGILSVFVTAPFWLAGFNVVAQMIEEKNLETSYRRFAAVLMLSIGTASLFYCLLILACSMATPWRDLIAAEFPAIEAFRAAFNSILWAKFVLLATLFGVVATCNSFFIAATRALFALGRARIIHPSFARIRSASGTPMVAVLFVGLVSGIGAILGTGAVVPIVNMDSACFVLMYLLVAVGVFQMRRKQPHRERPYRVPGGSTIPVLAIVASALMLIESVVSTYTQNRSRIPLEWILFVGWAFLGLIFWKLANTFRLQIKESQRRSLMLGTEETLTSTANSFIAQTLSD